MKLSLKDRLQITWQKLKGLSPLKILWFIIVVIVVIVTFIAPLLTIILQDERFNFGL